MGGIAVPFKIFLETFITVFVGWSMLEMPQMEERSGGCC